MWRSSVFLLFIVGCLFSAANARSKPPHRGSRSSIPLVLPQCLLTVETNCIQPLQSQFGSPHAFLDHLRATELRQICGSVTVLRDCVRTTLSEACSAQDRETLEQYGVMNTLREYRAAINYVCDENVDVFSRHKACLLRGTGHQLDVEPAVSSCVQNLTSPHDERCMFAPEVYGCISAAVTQQCGEEIASHIVQMGMKMHAACHQSGQRKRKYLFKLMRSSLWM